MVRRIALTICAAAVTLFAAMPGTAQAAGWWLQYSNGGQCMDVQGSSGSNGAIIQAYTCKNPGTSGAANQKFQTQASGSGYRVVASHSGKCIDIAGSSTADGAGAQQQSCNGSASQQWNLIWVSANPNGSNNYLFKNINSGKCLNRAATGYALYQVACNSGSSQQVWKQHLIESGCTTCAITRD